MNSLLCFRMTTAAGHNCNVGDAVSIKQHLYRVNPTKCACMQKEVVHMVEHGFVEPSQSPWCSPCVLVPKVDGTWRFCTDFWKVNNVMKSDCFPLPRIEDCIDCIGNSEFVCKLKGYQQAPLSEQAWVVPVYCDILWYTECSGNFPKND